ncbi:MAG: hypothetical protein EAZ60_25280 [Oscillatoriales cyanobacterium]|nr:MAG: hypothetical protein EAZ88_21555 [Oscillatoriales cyanobacterium]TAE70888.1 MAG: hypothetical protein EAZ86_05505 [Oscillatoriales cyanobacterium]TAE80004.1 MAG: hypothetical protein EAZ83_19535 [Oscillatoriales cyanobacterium]TAE99946.1 MAG: hypothetical protein EAZ79_04085 [Oscillatoriales cyanobacterium]TAF17534.1 MAG: hypothetical protein EAZ73_21025 [Oscillatoriales cyanobacterium]
MLIEFAYIFLILLWRSLEGTNSLKPHLLEIQLYQLPAGRAAACELELHLSLLGRYLFPILIISLL